MGHVEIVVGPLEAFREGEAGAGNLQAVVFVATAAPVEAIAHEGVVHLSRERLRALAAEPRLGERGIQGVVRAAVGGGVERELLSVAGGQRGPRLLVEQVARTEVVQRQTHLAYEHAAAVAALQVDGAGVALFYLVDDVHRGVLGVGARFGDDALFLEEAERQQFAAAAQQGVAAEEVAGARVQLAHDDFVVGNRVAFNPHIAYAGLLALVDAHLDVDAVAHHRHLDRRYLEEKVPVVHVQARNVGARGVVLQVLVQQLAVVGVAFADAQRAPQHVVAVHRVAREGDVAEVELLPLVHLHPYLHALLVGLLARRIPHRVAHDARVAVALLIVVGHHLVQVLAEVALDVAALLPEHLLPEPQLLAEVHIPGLLHLGGQRQVAHLAVALEHQRVNLDLLAALDVERNRQAARRVVSLGRGRNFHTRKAFADVVAFDFVGRRAQQVFRYHLARYELDFLAQLLVLALLHTREGELLQARALLEHYLEERDVALDAGNADLHILEHALLPQILDGAGNLVARYFHTVAHLQAGHQLHHAGVEILGALVGDTSDFVCLGGQIVKVVFLFAAHNHLGFSRQRPCKQEGCQQQQYLCLFHAVYFLTLL